jgi:hypothetical protein
MKSATEPKSPSTAARSKETTGNAFFQKGREEALSSELEHVQTFFSKQKTSAPFFNAIQPKLTVHPSNDIYEQEADAAAGRVVQGLHHAPAVQRQTEEEGVQTKPLAERITPVQTKRAFESPTPLELGSEDSEQPVQAKAEGEMETASPALESQMQSSKGQGSPLPERTRTGMESGFGADFSGVRTHTGSDAVQMNRQLGARAFTHGNDIYFSQGEYQPGTEEGDRLLAHELTHTVQQGGGIFKKRIQKSNGLEDSAPVPGSVDIANIPASEDGKIVSGENGLEIMLFDFLVKENISSEIEPPPYTMPREERNTKQKSIWNKNVRDHVEKSIDILAGPNMNKATNDLYRLRLDKNTNIAMVGSITQIVNESLVPLWSIDGTPTTFEIEHLLDWQIAGTDVVDKIENLILLEKKANGQLGNTLKKYKKDKIERVLKHYRTGGAGVEQSAEEAQKRYIIKVINIKPDFKVTGQTIKKENLEPGKPENPIRSDNLDLSPYEITPGHFLLKTAQRGVSYEFPYNITDYKRGNAKIKVDGNAKNHTIKELTIEFYVDEKFQKISKEPVSFVPIPVKDKLDLYRIPDLKNNVRNLFELVPLSPVIIDEFDFDPAFNMQAKGKVLPTVPLISNTQLDILIDGKNISVGKEFGVQDINIPSPFKVSNASLGLFLNTQSGILINGRINFGIDRVGEGYLAGSGKTDEFAVEGAFDFDSKLFNPARVNATYKNKKFSAEGEIGIPQGKIKGLKSANAKVSYNNEDLAITGAAQLDIPGFKKSDLAISYQNQQLTIGGKLELGGHVPGLKSATGDIEVTKIGEEWKVKASGTAEPDIPGVGTSLNISYDNGILDIGAKVAYAKGRLAGEIQVGATNRLIGADGLPGTEPTEKLTVHGSGQLGLEITPWLKATAGVKILPNGELEVLGRIELPDSAEVFSRKEINQNLFRMPTIEIPVFAIPLGPRSLGVVAQINGGLDFAAGIGPGKIQGLYGEIKYNPSHPEKTTLSGGGQFVVPADASLKLHADLGLGLSVAIASLTGGIELAGSLGLQGAAQTGIQLNWNPASGLELNALGEVKVSPKFKFDVNLIARASLDLLVTSMSKNWTYNLKSFEWGPGIEFGLRFPIHYKEGKPFEISFKDIEVIKPDIDIGAMAKGIAMDIKDKVF